MVHNFIDKLVISLLQTQMQFYEKQIWKHIYFWYLFQNTFHRALLA